MKILVSTRISTMVLLVVLALAGLEFCLEAESGTVRQHNLNELDSFFGPLPKAEQLITGVDLKGFIQTLLGDQAKLSICSPRVRSVGYIYKLSLASDSRTMRLGIDIGVYDSADTANSVLVDEWAAVSAPGLPASGFGDRALKASPTCVRTIVNNVFVCVNLSPANEELFTTIVDKLIQELRSGTTYVTRGKTVPVPRIASLNLPDRRARSGTYSTVVAIENTDTSKLLLGISGDEGVTVSRVGSEIRLNVSANIRPGLLKTVLCVATPGNVVANAEILAGSQAAKLNELAGRYMAGDPPDATEIDLKEYRELKTKNLPKENRSVGQGDNEPARQWVLDAFDESSAWVAVVTQYRSQKVWNWEKRYKLRRNAETDEELRIPQILKERQEVIAGVKYGMTVAEVVAKKGRHYKVNGTQVAGSAQLVYEDVTIDVVDWWTDNKGHVLHVEATTDRMKKFMKDVDVPYHDADVEKK